MNFNFSGLLNQARQNRQQGDNTGVINSENKNNSKFGSLLGKKPIKPINAKRALKSTNLNQNQNNTQEGNTQNIANNAIKGLGSFSFSDAKTKAFQLNGSNIDDLANKLNSQNAMGSSEAKQQAADNADLTKQGGLKGMFARLKEGGGKGLLKDYASRAKDDDKEQTNYFENNTAQFNPQLKISSLSSDAHLKDFFLACYTDNPYLKTLIKTKLMQEYFN